MRSIGSIKEEEDKEGYKVGISLTKGESEGGETRRIYLVCLVYFVSLVERNQRNQRNQIDEKDQIHEMNETPAARGEMVLGACSVSTGAIRRTRSSNDPIFCPRVNRN